MKKPWVALIVGAFVLTAFPPNGLRSHVAPAFPTRSSDAGGVKVVVTPKVMDWTASIWDFNVVIDTHTKALNENLAQAAVLVDDSGRRYAPIAWQGDPPGWHHRKGVLRFTAPTEMATAIELQISNVGGVPVRSFQWDLK